MLPPHIPTKGVRQVPQGAQGDLPSPTDRPDEGGQNLCGPTEGRPKAAGTGRKEERVDLGGHVENCQPEIPRALRSCKGSVPHSEVEPNNSSKFEGRQATVGRERGSGGGSAPGVVPPTPPEILAQDKGVVPACGRPCSSARSGYHQSDHIREGGDVHICPAHRDEYPHFCGAIPGGQLGTYGEKDRLGGETLTQSPLQGAVRDLVRTPENESGGGKKIREGCRNGRGGDNGVQGYYSI